MFMLQEEKLGTLILSNNEVSSAPHCTVKAFPLFQYDPKWSIPLD